MSRQMESLACCLEKIPYRHIFGDIVVPGRSAYLAGLLHAARYATVPLWVLSAPTHAYHDPDNFNHSSQVNLCFPGVPIITKGLSQFDNYKDNAQSPMHFELMRMWQGRKIAERGILPAHALLIRQRRRLQLSYFITNTFLRD